MKIWKLFPWANQIETVTITVIFLDKKKAEYILSKGISISNSAY